jgi:putative ABC transport system ATP-binding protein
MNIRLKDILVKIPKTKRILFEIEKLEIKKGSRILIKGPSGIGKTTLLHLIAGLFSPDNGEIFIDGKNINNLNDNEKSEFRRYHIGIIFQKLNILDHLTVFENVQLQFKKDKNFNKKVIDALEKIHISELSYEQASSLSLGEQQRVAVARVLCFSPDIVLADEPTSSLDDFNTDKVMDSILNLPKERTIITVSHDHRIESKFENVIDFQGLMKK